MSDGYEIDGLIDFKKMSEPPEDIMRIRRMSRYDKLIEDAKATTVKLTLRDAKRAANVYLALRERIKKVAKGKVIVGKRGMDVYAFPAKFAKDARKWNSKK